MHENWPKEKHCSERNLHKMEYMSDLKVPNIYKGKNVAIHVKVDHRNCDWKRDWHFEGISVTLNNSKHQISKSYILGKG